MSNGSPKPPSPVPAGTDDLPTLERPEGATFGLPSAASSARFIPGMEFGGYRLARLLGKGGFGQVWEAESLETGRRIALKVLTAAKSASSGERERFRREGRLAASLNHPHCVFVFAADEIQGYPTIAMELMPGGTLQDKLAKQGPLPFREAVDHVLDVIEGLEAAQAKGVIHRDVKPSNCFLDEQGRVRIGDFGLSKTLDLDSKLTVTGTFMGTPAYASPEQVRGRDVDFRSDLYAVGATLYALLAGRPAFEGSQPGETLARILSESPPSFAEHGVRVPKALERTVLRLMIKDRDRRFASYAALRAALLPFSTRLRAASPPARIAAGLIDSFVLFALHSLSLVALWGLGSLSLQPAPGSPEAAAHVALSLVLDVLYFALLEGLWGQSLGKRLFGLRVSSATGADLGFTRVVLRTLLYVGIAILPSVIPTLLASWEPTTMGWLSLALRLVGALALMTTMRMRNGYAGPHELLSGTRVTAVPADASERATAAASERRRDTRPASAGSSYGPYAVTTTLWTTPGEALLLARDAALDRDVWIHTFEDPTRATPVASLVAARAGRLRWLQGPRADRSWDAYEALSGSSLVEWARSRGGLPWSTARQVLAAALDSLQSPSDAAQPVLTVAHFWLDDAGRVKLLDFPALAETDTQLLVEASGDARLFLHQLLVLTLEGRALTPLELEGRLPRVALPLHAEPLVRAICSSSSAFSLDELSRELARIAGLPASVDTSRRAAALAMAGAVPGFVLLSLLTFFLVVPVETFEIPRVVRRARAAGADEATRPERERAADKLLSHAHAAATQGSSMGRGFLESFLATLRPEDRRRLDAARALYPSPSAEELIEARRLLGYRPLRKWFMVPLSLSFATVPAALLGLLGALAFRGGATLRAAGIAVKTKNGGLASRGRCLFRSFVALGPLLGTLAVIELGRLSVSREMREALVLPVFAGGLLLVAAGMLYAALRPQAGIQDLLAGTRLVPR